MAFSDARALKGLSTEQIASLRQAFRECDTDGSGAIDRYELQAALTALGREPESTEAMDAIMASIDEDGSGLIDFFEFVRLVVGSPGDQAGAASTEEEALGVFVSLGGHKDGTGQVSTSLLGKIVREFQLTVDIEALVRDADKDNSGYLDFEELCTVLTVSRPERGDAGAGSTSPTSSSSPRSPASGGSARRQRSSSWGAVDPDGDEHLPRRFPASAS